MRMLIILAAAAALSAPALADSCTAQAGAKNIHGAAQTSFMKKCSGDVKAKCASDASAKNLHGAAAKTFTDKCVREGTGA